MSFAAFLLEEGSGLVHLIYEHVVFFLDLLDELANGLVGSVRHDKDLYDEDKKWYNKVEEEELFRPKGAITPLVDYSVDEKDGTRRVECTCEKCKDESRVFGESIGELEGRDENEWSAKRKKQISRYVSIERQLPRKCEEKSTNRQQQTSNDSAYPWAIFVQNSSNWQRGNIRSNRCYCEHEVKMYFLIVTCPYILVQLLFRA